MPKKTFDAPEQHSRFLETARALGCDEDEAAFDEKLKAITKPESAHKDIPRKGLKGEKADV